MKTALTIALALTMCVPAEAGFRRFRDGMARPRQQRMVMGDEAAEKVSHLLTDLTWRTSLDDALKVAATQDKLVFWVHMLGRIDGPT